MYLATVRTWSMRRPQYLERVASVYMHIIFIVSGFNEFTIPTNMTTPTRRGVLRGREASKPLERARGEASCESCLRRATAASLI